MSVFKQLEKSELTVEEIQELIALLDDVIPKIESKVKQSQITSKLADNLRENLKNAGTVFHKATSPEKDLNRGLRLLKTTKEKLDKFVQVITDVD